MNNLKPLSKRHLHHLSEIIDAKTGDRGVYLTKHRDELEKLFASYEKEFSANNLESIQNTAINLKGKLARLSLHCYNSSTGALAKLKQEITDNQESHLNHYCPYCGVGAGKQFDHYIPKTKFPEYAIHALNLIPCCSTCNGKKSETWLVAGERVFINLYTDTIPVDQFLFAKIAWKKSKGIQVPAAEFSLARPSGCLKKDFNRITEHYKRLELLKRYREWTYSCYFSFHSAAKVEPTTDASIVKVRLKRFSDRFRTKYGNNYWQVVLMDALISDSTFIAQCTAI
jgi:hypothetical protein